MAAVFIVQTAGWRPGVTRAEVEVLSVKGEALSRVGELGVVGGPSGRVFEVGMGVVAQESRVVDGAVVAGVKVHVAAVKGPAVEARGVQTVGVAGVVGGPSVWVFEIGLGVEAEDAAVDGRALILVADGAEVCVAPVEYRAEVALGHQAVGVAGVIGGEGVECGAGLPLRDQRLHGFGTDGGAFDPSGDRQRFVEGTVECEGGVGCATVFGGFGHGVVC